MKKNAYFVGIKGVAMTALAVLLKEKGYLVTGSDISDEFATDAILARERILVKPGFSPKNIDKHFDLVVVTGAHGGMTNPEARRAKELMLPTCMHGQALGMIMDTKVGISVAGCHGKTTTAAMTASLLSHAGLDPSYAIGTATIADLGYAGHFGKGAYFVAEADEYMTCPVTDPTPRFLWQHPKILVLTNIDFDHPDAFSDISAVKSAYISFTQNLVRGGIIIACIDNSQIVDILPKIKNPIITYGFSPRADFRISRDWSTCGVSRMRISHQNVELGDFTLHVPGRHNMRNATGAMLAAQQTGIAWKDIKKYMKYFSGSKRRFEKIGETDTFTLYDDYAHHPSEIQATITAAKAWFPDKKLIIIFQPHTFSRTKSLLMEFAASFQKADKTLIADIYPSAREKADPSISSSLLVYHATKVLNNVVYTPDKKAVLKWLEEYLKGDELVMTMGAGDIFLWHKDILELFAK